MFIPPQLRRPEFRFCKVRGKRPYEPAWQERNNYRYDDQSLHDSFSNDQGYGVIGGYGGLLVVDGDSHEIIEDVFPRLPKTFSVLTGSGKLHCYYIIDDCTSFKATGQDGQTLVDFQGRGKQVIGPGSVYPGSDRRYTVLDDLPIASITRKDLIRHFADFLSLDNVIPPKPIQRHTTGENAATAIKTALPLSRVLAGEGVNIQRGNTACLWHPSQRGKCLVFDDAKGLWYCFHCAQGGDVITFIQIHRRLDFIGACRYLTDTLWAPHQPRQRRLRPQELRALAEETQGWPEWPDTFKRTQLRGQDTQYRAAGPPRDAITRPVPRCAADSGVGVLDGYRQTQKDGVHPRMAGERAQ